jgi:hypothetical protein
MYKLVKYLDGGLGKEIISEHDTEDAANEAFEGAVANSEFYDVFNIETE